MFSRTNKTKKSLVGAIAMAVVLLFVNTLTILIQTGIGQISPPIVAEDSWTAHTVTPVGTGFKSSPYKIDSAYQLAWLIENMRLRADNAAGESGLEIYIELMADINLAGHEWSPIKSAKPYNAPGTGTINQGYIYFEGNNHTISNLTILKQVDRAALFMGKTKHDGRNISQDLRIKNLTLANVNINGGTDVGAVVGWYDYSSGMENVRVTSGDIIGVSRVGGLVGNSTSFIKNCVNNANVTARENEAGGIVGVLNSRTVSNCINTGTVSGKTGAIGGIAGGSLVGAVENCLAECTLMGPSGVGGLIGCPGDTNVLNSGFKGTIYAQGSTVQNVGSIFGTGTTRTTVQIENNFGIAEIYTDITSTTGINSFGMTGNTNATSCYNYSKIINSEGGISELRKYKVKDTDETPFSGFAFHKNINGGYPFPRQLFAVGQYIESDTMSYLKNYGFERTTYQIKNDGTHYYVELGEYPQTYVGDSMNNTLKSWYAGLSISNKYAYRAGSYINDNGTSGTVTHYVYKYTANSTFLRVESAVIYATGYTFANGTTAVSGNEYWFKVEPIKWWVLNYTDVINNNANPVVLAEQGLTSNIRWNKNPSDQNLWSGACNIRTWLNGTFYNNAFNADAKVNIKTTTVGNNTQSSYDDTAGVTTQDNVWLLSNNEANSVYFTSNTQRLCSPTDYALVNNCYSYSGTCAFWLRSASTSYTTSARLVASNGSVGNGSVVGTDNAVRPALTLHI